MKGDSLDTSNSGIRSIGRSVVLVTLLTTIILTIAVSCGGGDDDDATEVPSDGRPPGDVQMATFTPTVPAATPDPNITPTATEVPPTIAVLTPGTQDEDAFRPPVMTLSDGNNEIGGEFGSYGLIDEESLSYVLITAPFFDVGEEGLTVAPGATLTFSLEDANPPTQMTAAVYTWDENNAIPQDVSGETGDHPWFIQTVAPLDTFLLSADDPSFTMPQEPGRYVVQVEVRWPDDERLPEPLRQPQFSAYAFTVHVS